MRSGRLLYLPIEIKARELLGKIWLASRAAERGWLVLLGPQKEVFRAARRGLAGAFVENGIPEDRAAGLEAYRQRGHRIVNLCEESVVYNTGSHYCTRKVGPTSLERTDMLLVSGEWNGGHLREYRPASASKIRMTGNPRFDTLLPGLRVVYEAEAQQLRERFGRFLLVNTNFGASNPFERGRDVLAAKMRRGKIADEAQVQLFQERQQYKRRQEKQLKALLRDVAARGTFDNIVVRPHPVENHDAWREWAMPLGVEIRYEGTANVWMLAADIVLHTGCTTGIESILLNRPAATFVVDGEQRFLNCADQVSVAVGSTAEFLEKVAEWRAWAPDEVAERLAAQRTQIRAYIDNVEPPLSADRIMDALEELDLPVHSLDAALRSWGTAFSAREWLVEARTAVRRIRYGSSRADQKFPGIVPADITTPVQSWIGAGALAHAPQVRKLGVRMWLVY
jgi:surface carbohydrate biosynthesis protein